MDKRYRKRREEIANLFTESNCLTDETETILSPSGQYELTVEYYKTREGAWNYSMGIVRQVSDGSLIADVKRNYSHFWHCWHIHENLCEYLLCGEDYQGYTVVNATKRQVQTHFPDEGYRGVGFCWTAAYPSPDSTILAIDGCYWACPYEIVFFDFANPDELPYREIARIGMLDEVGGWKDNETFVLTIEQEIRKSDAKLYDELSREEQEELDSNSDLVDCVVQTVEYKPREITQK